MSTDDLQLGVLLAEPAMERWAAAAVEEAVRTADISVEQVILPVESESASSNRWERYATSVLEYGAWTPVLAWHRLVNTPPYLEKVPIDDLSWLDGAERIRTRTEPADGIGQRLPASTIDRIESAGIDLLFRRGFGILQGDVLAAPTHGVLSYHHGNVREYRGRPPGVWEFANDESTAGITLQRLTPTLDGGEIVVEKTIDVADCRTWQAVERTLFEHSTDMLATACTRLTEPTFEARTPDDLGPLYTCPGAVDTVRIELENARGKVANAIED
ncbi:formyltransferase family protein [Halosolutus amylolyticus]|uniref:Formyltransferase family protein n=1 Tax=Halosolutus amylolyticus TaxID=2932267 RepID=A0ABD5PME5_9EURY|nr:formyltransferase family protein [Halosolutus amylolyticus]